MKIAWSSFFLAALLLAADGCKPRGELPVHGSVTLDGAPLAAGSISFQPTDPSKSKGSGATIRDGRYEIPASHGLPPGKYLVTIRAFRLTGRMLPDPTGGPEKPEAVPLVFAEKMPLEATISAGDNVRDFQLTGAK